MIWTTSLGQECRVVTVRGSSEPTLTLKFTLVDSTFTLWNAWLTWLRCSVDKVTLDEFALGDPAVPFAALEAAPDGLEAAPAAPRVVAAFPEAAPPELPPVGLGAVPLDEPAEVPDEVPVDAPTEVPPEVAPEAPAVVPPDVPPPIPPDGLVVVPDAPPDAPPDEPPLVPPELPDEAPAEPPEEEPPDVPPVCATAARLKQRAVTAAVVNKAVRMM